MESKNYYILRNVHTCLLLFFAPYIFCQGLSELKLGTNYYRNGMSVLYTSQVLQVYTSHINRTYNTFDLLPNKYDNNCIKHRKLESHLSFNDILNRNYTVFGNDLEEISLTEADNAAKNAVNASSQEESVANALIGVLGGIGAVSTHDRVRVSRLNLEDEVTRTLKMSLSNQSIGNDIFSKLFSRKDDGSFSIELLAERGLYASGAQDFAKSDQAALKKNILYDNGLKLIHNAYVLVMFYNCIETEQEWKNRVQPYLSANKTYSGYRADAVAYIFKLDVSKELVAQFWEEMWIEEGQNFSNSEVKRRKELFDQTNFPLKYMSSVCAWNVYGATVEDMLKNATSKTLEGLEKEIEELMVKLPVTKVDRGLSPKVNAKIGRKESLQKFDRYFVYENQMTATGGSRNVRIGAVRAKRVVNNYGLTYAETSGSDFVQISGKRIYPGHLLVEKKDRGEVLNLTWGTSVVKGPEIKYSFGKFSKGFCLVGFDYEPSIYSYSDGDDVYDVSFSNSMLRMGVGYQYNWFLKRFSLGLNVGSTFEYDLQSVEDKQVSYEGFDLYGGNSDDVYSPENDATWFLHLFLGCEIGFSLSHNTQLLCIPSYYHPISYSLYEDVLENKSREGLQWQFGIRFSR